METSKLKPHFCGMEFLKGLPEDNLYEILSFLSAREIDANVSSVCCWFRVLSSSEKLWKILCQSTGKIPLTTNLAEKRIDSKLRSFYRNLYYSTPCVPLDYKTIKRALHRCNACNEVVLLPGIYSERVIVKQTERQPQAEGSKLMPIHVSIRAAFPEKGAALTFVSSTAIDEACIHISGEHVSVNITNIQILHSSRGNDIWGGNCAIFCEGGATATIQGCKICSESGRGVVLLSGSTMNMSNCTVADCAATGCYVSDPGTTFLLSASNIIRNGVGTRRSSIVSSSPGNTNFNDFVPPGHSGLYIESGKSVIENCLISGNLLTGVSVVRNGFVHMTDSDLTENGEGWLDIEMEGDDTSWGNTDDGQGFRSSFHMIKKNNLRSLPPANDVLLGGFIRTCTYSASLTDTLDSLTARYL